MQFTTLKISNFSLSKIPLVYKIRCLAVFFLPHVELMQLELLQSEFEKQLEPITPFPDLI